MVSDAADLVDMADKVGVSTENIQRMVYGFGQAGVAAEDIDKILTQWAKRIGEAHTRGGQLADIFRANNIALTDSEGRLRSSVELMRDYANLIAGAGSDQERMALATLAFGDAGEAMVLALRDGAEGMDRLMKSTDAAGGVLEDKLLRRQAEIDEAFGRMWRNFETNAKSAILSAVTWLDDLRQGFREISDGYAAQQNAAELGAFAGGLAGTPRPARGDRLPSGVDRRIEAAFAGAAPEGNEAMTRMLRDRFGLRTVIPRSNDNGDTPSRTASISAARDQETAYQRVVEQLREERAMLGLNATEQRILSEQRRAGVSAASEQGKAIEAVVRADRGRDGAARQVRSPAARSERSGQESGRLRPRRRACLGAGRGDGGRCGTRPRQRNPAGSELRRPAGRGAFGRPVRRRRDGGGGSAGGGGLVGLLLGGATRLFGGGAADPWAGFRAQGGPVDPFKTYVVGEKGPELLRMGGRSGYVVPNKDAFGSGVGPARQRDLQRRRRRTRRPSSNPAARSKR